MARNRKRAKERRARRPQPVASARVERDESPAPIVHAAPDVELAEAQLAVGRPELAGVEDEEPEIEELETEVPRAEHGADAEVEVDGRAERAAAPLPAERSRPGGRLVTFLQGSWRELQRVQWPDRRQVVQATAVVIGFVIVAGIFLGVSDAVASKLMNLILK